MHNYTDDQNHDFNWNKVNRWRAYPRILQTTTARCRIGANDAGIISATPIQAMKVLLVRYIDNLLRRMLYMARSYHPRIGHRVK